jgi:serine/threonine-protein kinase
VIHRDIKPENILLQDGRALVADFGIALAVSAAAGGRMTETGLSLGTPHYMSPEQATAEKELTPRSDVYSLGSVLYEMLAGEPPHTGGSAQAVIMKIVTDRARPVSELRRSVPANVAAAVEKSLEKLAADRFETAKAFSEALANPGFTTIATGTRSRAGTVDGERWRRIALALGALAALAVLVAAASFVRLRDGAPGLPSIRTTIELPNELELPYQYVSFSPDGSSLFAMVEDSIGSFVWERRLSEFEGRRVAGTEGGGHYPFTSPDGTFLYFNGDCGLCRVSLSGGPATSADPEAGIIGPGAWGPDGTLYYGRKYNIGLWQIKPGRTDPTVLTVPDSSANELGHSAPQVLPGGRYILFATLRTPHDSSRIEIVDVRSGTRRVVLRNAVTPVYAGGYLLFGRKGSIFAAPFDVGRLEVTGEPAPIVNDVAVRAEMGTTAYAVSPAGDLAYIPSSGFHPPSTLVWVDRQGREASALPGAAGYGTPAISPDGGRVAIAISEPGEASDLWVIDLTRGGRTRLTSGGGLDREPVWFPDGRSVAWVSERPFYDIYRRAADASSPAAPLITTRFDKGLGSFTRDGRALLFEGGTESERRSKIQRVSSDGQDRTVVLEGDWSLAAPEISPNGRWLAVQTEESGRYEVSVVSYPDPGRVRRAVSVDGGTSPRWTKGGRELVWQNGGRFMAASVEPESGVIGVPRTLFNGNANYLRSDDDRHWDVTADGERFLVLKRDANQAPRRIMLVTNFVQGLRKRVSSKQ